MILILALSASLAAAQDAGNRAVAALRQGDAATAEKELRAELQIHPANPALLSLLGVALDAEKNFDEAGKTYRQALTLGAPSVSLLNNYGNHLVSVGKAQEARVVFLRVLAADHAHPNANEQLARMAVEAGQGKEALGYLGHLLPQTLKSPELALLHMSASYLAGRDAEADAALAAFSASAQDDARINFSIALALGNARQYGRAESYFSRALDLDPANFDILYNLGLAAGHAGHQQRALEVLTTAWRMKPDDADVLYNLAATDVALHRNDDALVWLSHAAKVAPQRADIARLIARIAFQEADYSDSAEAWNRCVELEPRDDEARRERGFSTALAGERAKGLVDLDWYVERHPNDAAGQYEDGAVQFLSHDAALRHLNRAIALDPDMASAYYARGVIYSMGNQLKEAVADLQQTIKLAPANSAALDKLGVLYLDMERAADALQVLRKAAELDPGNTAILFHLGRALSLTGHGEESRAVFERLRALGSRKNGVPNRGFVDLLGESPEQQYTRYRARVEKAIAANPSDVSAKLRLLKLELMDQDWAHAESLAQEIAALHPPDSLLAEAGRALLEAERYSSAKQLLAQCANAAGASLDLAIASFYADGPAAGLRQMDAVPSGERNGDYYLALAQMLDRAGRPREAIAAAANAIRSAPTRAELYEQVSFLLYKNNQVDQARTLLDLAAKRLPDDRSILLSRAIMLELGGLLIDADEQLKQIEKRWPEWPQAYFVSGIIWQTQNHSDKAQAALKTAIALGTREPAAWYYLAEAILKTRPDDLAEASDAIQQALLLDPGDAWTHALAGRIALQRKQYDEAVAELQEAIRERPIMVQAHYNLARAYTALGRKDAASDEFRKTQELGQQYPNEADDPDLLHSNLLGITLPQ